MQSVIISQRPLFIILSLHSALFYHCYNLSGIPHGTFLLFKQSTLPVQIPSSSISVDENYSIRTQCHPKTTFQTSRRISFLSNVCSVNSLSAKYRTTLQSDIFGIQYLFIRFACISYGRFIAMRYNFKLSTCIQEPLVIGGRGCVQREISTRKRLAGDNGHKQSGRTAV